MVGAAEVHHLEDDPFRAIYCWSAEGDWQRHLPDRVCLLTGDDAMEGRQCWLDGCFWELEPFERVEVQDIDGSPTVH